MINEADSLIQFNPLLLAWFDQHGRKNLPWQRPRSPYRVWISEIMLQQTQVKTVIPYFERFMSAFPNISSLANATEDEVLSHWSGLGYYSRGRNLLKAAKIIYHQHAGEFPNDLSTLTQLPGIGPSTAAAIASQAFGKPTAILDGNVKRVLCRYFMIEGWPEKTSIKNKLWQLASQCMPHDRCADYTQAIMDLGATCCKSKNPDCSNCPLKTHCKSYSQGRVLEFPQKPLKKKLPFKKQQFLLLYTPDNKVYLERRPPVGIWGGLWCLPVIDELVPAEEFIKQTFMIETIRTQELTPHKHSFTHFHLFIKPIAMQVEFSHYHVAEQPGKWLKLLEMKGIGLPKPIQVIIDQFKKDIMAECA